MGYGNDNAPGTKTWISNDRLKLLHETESFRERLVKQAAEIERLKAELKEITYADYVHADGYLKERKENATLRARVEDQERQLQAYETQLTLQEDGPKSLLERLEKQKRDLDYYAGRVAKLEEQIQADAKVTKNVLYANESFRAQVEKDELIHRHNVDAYNRLADTHEELKARVAKLEASCSSAWSYAHRWGY